MIDGVALIAFDAAIVKGKDHFVVAANLTDVRLGQAHVAGTYVCPKGFEDTLKEVG